MRVFVRGFACLHMHTWKPGADIQCPPQLICSVWGQGLSPDRSSLIQLGSPAALLLSTRFLCLAFQTRFWRLNQVLLTAQHILDPLSIPPVSLVFLHSDFPSAKESWLETSERSVSPASAQRCVFMCVCVMHCQKSPAGGIRSFGA